MRAPSEADDLDEYATRRRGSHHWVHVKQHGASVLGDWKMEDKTIISTASQGTFLKPPVPPQGEFEYKVFVTREKGTGEFRIAVPEHGVVVIDGGGDNATSGLELLDDKGFAENESTVRTGRPVIQPGVPVEIVCVFRKSGVRVLCNGKQLLKWRGDVKRLQHPRGSPKYGIGSSGCVTRVEGLIADKIIY